jgi:hypothetical protein
MNVQDQLLEYEKKLIGAEKHIFFNDSWQETFPNHSGVYVIWEKEQPVYVGETLG